MPTELRAVPYAHAAVHDTVISILKDAPRGPVLDVPAGEGALAERLALEGFPVRCCDLHPEIFRLPDIEILRGDMTQRLPYPDAEFSYVTCLEGLEHVENPAMAIREFYRVLKPGGQLIASIPNILNIEERFKWLLHGYTSHFKPLSQEYLDRVRRECGGRMEIALHIHAIGYPELRYYLENTGFQLMDLHRDKLKAALWLYWPAAMLLRLLGKFTSGRKRRERWTSELNSDPVLLGGNTLIVRAIKSD